MNTLEINKEEVDLRVWPLIFNEDEYHLVLYKPSGIYVHPPENPRLRRGLRRHTCTQWLKDEKKMIAFPAHRLDFGTEGLLLFGKDRDSTRFLNNQFIEKTIQKKYYAVVRGWFQEKEKLIDLPLELDSTGDLVECKTRYKVIKEIEHNVAVSKKFATSRYSLIEVEPITGRWHQIRRHMNRLSHPVIGDREHGDSHHNRYFRDTLKIDGLCLWAQQLTYLHPQTGEKQNLYSPRSKKWTQIQTLFDFEFQGSTPLSTTSDILK